MHPPSPLPATHPPSLLPATHRQFFLDWVRIIGFFVLILYHVGMVYVSWDYHVKSSVAVTALEPLMQMSSPWRLGLLFLISGAACGWMLQKSGPGRFVRQRSVRLLPPLLFGMALIVPPQAYVEVVEKLGYQGSFMDFMQLYYRAYQGFCRDGHCLDLPTWNHLWFVAYLWAYALVLAAIVWLVGKRFAQWSEKLAGWLQGWKIIAVPVLVLWLARILLASQFPQTHDLVSDWYNHAQYSFLFVLGAMVAAQPRFWQQLDDVRWFSLATAFGCWATLVVYYHLPDSAFAPSHVEYWRYLLRMVYASLQWCAPAAACGFAHRHLQFDSAKRRYLTEAVFPVYILHQTFIVVLEHFIKLCKLEQGTEALVLIVLTLTLSYGGYELVRRVRVLRPLFGLAPMPDDKSPLTPLLQRGEYKGRDITGVGTNAR